MRQAQPRGAATNRAALFVESFVDQLVFLFFQRGKFGEPTAMQARAGFEPAPAAGR